jgi:acetyl-CoA carboxylase carboxyltransferase component/biotin carboxyl carrier protein
MKNTWSYFSVGNNSKILPSVDGQFGHAFSFGDDREDARNRMTELLGALTIHGNIFNTAKFLKKVIQTPEYVAQTHHTQWLASVDIGKIIHDGEAVKTTDSVMAIIGSTVLAHQDFTKNWAEFDTMIEKGHSPNENLLKLRMEKQVCFRDMQYNLVFWCAPGSQNIVVEASGQAYTLQVFHCNSGIYVQKQGQIYHVNVVQANSSGTMIRINNSVHWFPVYQDPTVLRTQTGGRLVRFLQENGAYVKEGEHFAEIEIMKMILKLDAKIAGKISHATTEGQSLEPGQVIANIEPEAAEAIVAMAAFQGDLGLERSTTKELSDIRMLWRQYVSRIPSLEDGQTRKGGKITDKRVYCLHNNTTYIYDLFEMFNAEQEWELVMDNNMNITEAEPVMGKNTVGMVGRRMVLKGGQEIVVVGNDITFVNGSFGAKESQFYVAASKYAAEKGLPRIYISANSGARIEVDNKLRSSFMIEWNDNGNISKGVRYLYLTKESYQQFKDQVFATENEKGQWVIERILSPGVGNLDAAAWTASETVRTYDKVPTIVYVTGRSVGIGAYLCKLNERVVQKRDSPILLTGFKSLNTVLGQSLYKSNLQIGGPDIMGNNGISHVLVDSDVEGVDSMLRWLAFQTKGAANVSAGPAFTPSAEASDADVRGMINAVVDEGSFMELQKDWAKSMVVGRGRVGGIPIGILANNPEMTQKQIPVDPGNLESALQTLNQSGCLWYPDSTLKTSQAFRDIDTENLPIVMFANLRGFSGGTTDMFQEILKFGAGIVHVLESVKQPVYIYLPPHAQLRGGAMVVLSKSINQDKIHIWADPQARLNILEPNALKSIKFRKSHAEELVTRQGLEVNDQTMASAEPAIEMFFNLQDKPQCSLGVVDKVVPWSEFREQLIGELTEKGF